MIALLVACEAERDVRVTFVPTQIGNVVTVSWESELPVAGYVAAPEGNETPAVTTDAHAHTLWGLEPDTTVSLVVFEDDAVIATVDVTTDAPPDLPAFTVEQGDWDGLVAIPYSQLDGPESGVVVIDGSGSPRGWMVAEPLVTTAVFDRGAIWYDVMKDPSEIRRVPLDGREGETWVLPDAHHEFVVADDGPVYLRTTTQTVEGEIVFGDQIVAAEGDRVLWDAFDTLPIVRHEAWASLPEGADWTHANGLSRTDEGWLVSLLWLRQVLEVDDEGVILRTLDGAEHGFGPQHAPEPEDGGVVLFDNQLLNGHSRVLSTTWDGATRWEWSPEPAITTLVLGDVDRLADGRVLTAWGTDGALVGLDAALTPIWKVRAEAGYVVGQPAAIEARYGE